MFLFPSIYEGLGISLIEAEANGLTSFASDNVPKETKINDNVYYLPLNIELFVNNIINCNIKRTDNNKIINSIFDINKTVKEIENIYRK